MKSIFCGKRDARAVLVLYKYCPYFLDFVGICFDLVLISRRWFSWLEKLQTHIHLKFDNGLISEMAKEKPQDVLHILWLYIFILQEIYNH